MNRYRTCSWSVNRNRTESISENQNQSRHATWSGTQNQARSSRSASNIRSAVEVTNLNHTRIPRYLGSTSSISSTISRTTSPDCMFPSLNMNLTDLDSSDSDTECSRAPSWRNADMIHSYCRSNSTISESQPTSRATSVSSCRTRSSSNAGGRCYSTNSSWGRQTRTRNSRSTSSIRSAVVMPRTDSQSRVSRTSSQSRIPIYLGSTTSVSSISPMSTELRVPGLDFNYTDLDLTDTDCSERTRCDSTCVALGMNHLECRLIAPCTR